MKKIILLPVFLFLIIIGCSPAPESIPDPKNVSFLSNGIWLGILPCADCDEIDYQLNLKNNYTYKQKSIYKGKSEEIFIDEGNWSFVSDSVIELESFDYGKMFLISGKELIMLNEYGDRFESSLEDKYYLHKDESTVKDIEEAEDVKPVKEVVETNSVNYQEKYLDGVDLFARGIDPNWILEIDLENEIKFTALDLIKLNVPAVEGIKVKDTDVTSYYSKTKSGELLVTVTKTGCLKNISGEKFNYTVKVEAKDSTDKEFRTFEGCGNYLFDTRLHDVWVLEEMTGVKLKKPTLPKGIPMLEFYPEEMRFSGHSGCNNLSGSISVEGNKITFGNLMGTLTACTDMTVERALVKALDQKTVTYSIDKLKLTLVSGKTKMVFKKID